MATKLARWLWWLILSSMRRPSVRLLQLRMLQLLPERRQMIALDNIHRQNRWARRYGLPVLVVTIRLCLISIMFSVTFQLVILAVERGALTIPDASMVTR